jgi:hypothetical protein
LESDPGTVNYDQSMTAAIFGLIGVVVGGLLNGAVTALQARRADRADTRVSARLVDLELRQAGLWLVIDEDTTEETSAPSMVQQRFMPYAWDKHREVLARALSDKEWETVTAAYEIITDDSGRKPDRSDADVVTNATLIVRRVGERPNFGRRIERMLRL